MDGFEFDVLDEISHSFEQLALEKIDSATFDDNVTKLKELTSKATTVLSDIKNEVSLINASKEYNQHVLSKIDVVRENERKEYNELLLVLKDERQRYNELKSRLIELENKYKSSCPDHTLMTKVLREQMQWQTALESTLLETSKLKHEYKLAKQKIFELQQENIIKIEHSRMFYEFLKAALKIAVLEVTPSRSTLVIAPLEKEDKWMLIDTDSASRDSLWRLLAER
ncbi:hypothetical protein BMR1_03g02040 [Babesia microti strain RI]|uniref:Uncharacterized protein n=1 Tax=Babesia microti (strain RI) TaxID=1133968 RepID=A0A1R4ABU8_BABMR|nr:hypothetical protein BMR1_03g02040 [Babesia microti strain RI]SJK86415.1 hypothetical protein BMR1_03g02040 [Babesia microti strain RI]|eukprot:XP_021338576.1 hypothetical protein BMR1_03g02040 [Babesia microti strain RI]